MALLRKAAQCIGITGPFSIVHDFFGFFTGTPAGMSVSVRRQADLLKGRHIHLNAIATGPMQPDELAHIDQAIQVARDLFVPGGIGIGRVQHFDLGAGGYEIIVDAGVAYDLWDSYSAPGVGLDAFFCYRIRASHRAWPRDGPTARAPATRPTTAVLRRLQRPNVER